MKVFMVEYTSDFGETVHTMLVNADDYSKAYLDAYLQLPKDAAITDLFEVK